MLGPYRSMLMAWSFSLFMLAKLATATLSPQLACEDIAGEEFCARYRTLDEETIEAEIDRFRVTIAEKSGDEVFVAKVRTWQATEAYDQLVNASDGEAFSAACNKSVEAFVEMFDEPGRRRSLLGNRDCVRGCLNLAIRAAGFCVAFLAGTLLLSAIVLFFIPIIGPIATALAAAFMAAVCGTSGVGVATICNNICN